MNLQEQGFRFVSRDGACEWRHPLDVEAGDIDCTDMGDAEFEKFILGQQA